MSGRNEQSPTWRRDAQRHDSLLSRLTGEGHDRRPCRGVLGADPGMSVPSEREKMLRGELYDASDGDLVAARVRNRARHTDRASDSA